MTAYKHKVQYYETDKMGIVHHSNYIRWMEEARGAFLDNIGWPFKKLESMGMASPVVSVDIKYIHPTSYSDIVEIQTELIELGISKFKVEYKMFLGQTLVCTGSSSHGMMTLDGKPMRTNEVFPEFFDKMKMCLKKD